jgi:hypothetical protein
MYREKWLLNFGYTQIIFDDKRKIRAITKGKAVSYISVAE